MPFTLLSLPSELLLDSVPWGDPPRHHSQCQALPSAYCCVAQAPHFMGAIVLVSTSQFSEDRDFIFLAFLFLLLHCQLHIERQSMGLVDTISSLGAGCPLSEDTGE